MNKIGLWIYYLKRLKAKNIDFLMGNATNDELEDSIMYTKKSCYHYFALFKCNLLGCRITDRFFLLPFRKIMIIENILEST